jgi:succinate dehydrogenase/fumarate reductase flavoprotein subunit
MQTAAPASRAFPGGEVAGGIHGRNRLMGNSLLDVCVFGRRAGVTAAEYQRDAAIGQPDTGALGGVEP